VCPTDASAGTRVAVAQAAVLARVRRQVLHLLRAGGEDGDGALIADALQSTLGGVRGREAVRFRMGAQRGGQEKAIAAHARRSHAGLIVISAAYGGRGASAGRSLITSLGRSAPCPVLVVPGAARRGDEAVHASFRRVVCAVDFTNVSLLALEAAAAFAPPGGGQMTLVHAVGDISGGTAFSGSEVAQLARHHADHAAVTARSLLHFVPVSVLNGYRVKPVVGSGRPARRIVEVASETKADLIVMGMPHRSRLDEWLGGSTSRGVLRHAKCPVLLVPELESAAHRPSSASARPVDVVVARRRR
jgi:nucleotide-binding universal stress UspA family protein